MAEIEGGSAGDPLEELRQRIAALEAAQQGAQEGGGGGAQEGGSGGSPDISMYNELYGPPPQIESGGGRGPGLASPLVSGPPPNERSDREPHPEPPSGGGSSGGRGETRSERQGGSEGGQWTPGTSTEGRPQGGATQGRPGMYNNTPEPPGGIGIPGYGSWFNYYTSGGGIGSNTKGDQKSPYDMGPNSFYQPYTGQPNTGNAAEHNWGPNYGGGKSSTSGPSSGPASAPTVGGGSGVKPYDGGDGIKEPDWPKPSTSTYARQDGTQVERQTDPITGSYRERVVGGGADAARKEFGDVGPWAHGFGPRYEQYSEKRDDGSIAVVTYDRATGKYSSATPGGQAMPNVGGGGAPGGGPGDTGSGGGGGGGYNKAEADKVEVAFRNSSGENNRWWSEFERAHAGMDPIAFFSQPNNWKGEKPPSAQQALEWALADRAWGDALFRERGFAPTAADWGQHYGDERQAKKVLPPYPGMANTYRGGAGDLMARTHQGGGGGGGASSGTAANGLHWRLDEQGRIMWYD